jgi:hypothetical protein
LKSAGAIATAGFIVDHEKQRLTHLLAAPNKAATK